MSLKYLAIATILMVAGSTPVRSEPDAGHSYVNSASKAPSNNGRGLHKARVVHTEKPDSGTGGATSGTASLALLYGCRGGAQGIPFVNTLAYQGGSQFYEGDINSPRSSWESAVMQAVWQLWYEACLTKDPQSTIALGTYVVDGQWSKTNAKSGFNWHVTDDPQVPVPESNKGCTIWTPFNNPFIYAKGDVSLLLTITENGSVTPKLIASTLTAQRTKTLIESFRRCSGHPAFRLPPGYKKSSIALTVKLDASREPGPLVKPGSRPEAN